MNIKRGFSLGLVLVKTKFVRITLCMSYVSLNHTKNKGFYSSKFNSN